MKRRYCVLKRHDIKPQNRSKGKIMDEVTVYKNREVKKHQNAGMETSKTKGKIINSFGICRT